MQGTIGMTKRLGHLRRSGCGGRFSNLNYSCGYRVGKHKHEHLRWMSHLSVNVGHQMELDRNIAFITGGRSSQWHKVSGSGTSVKGVMSTSMPSRLLSTGTSSGKNSNDVSKLKQTMNDYLKQLSTREEVELEQRILNAISWSGGVKDPLLKKDIRSLGWVQSIEFSGNESSSLSLSERIFQSVSESQDEDKDDTGKNDGGTIGGRVTVHLSLPTLMHPNLEQIKRELYQVVEEQMIYAMAEKEMISKDDMNINLGQNIYEHINISITASKPSPFVRNVDEQDELIQKLGPGLANVRHFLAVYSCKGGVGKSTIAANLAYELARVGGRVGLLDVDVYGPSLPVLVKPDDSAVKPSPVGRGMVKPIEHKGVKMLSLGFVSPKSGVPGSGPSGGAAVMRGPMAGRVVTQLLKGTEWGDLDVLVLDMPPGTGDVQLSICQDLELSGAVSVTTPSKLAVTDAVKGIEMFTSLGVPTLAIVENMSYFDCEGGTRHYPFGESIMESAKMMDEMNININEANIFQLPISSRTNEATVDGIPLCLSRPEEASEELSAFSQLSHAVASDLFLLQYGKTPLSESGASSSSSELTVRLDGQLFDVASLHMSVENAQEIFTIRLFSDSGAVQADIPGSKLRTWHPKLGVPMDMEADEGNNGNEDSDSQTIKVDVTVTKTNAQTQTKQSNTSTSGGGCGGGHHSHSHDRSEPTLFPCRIEKKGRYGYSVEWADGATIIYSMYSLAKAAEGSKPVR